MTQSEVEKSIFAHSPLDAIAHAHAVQMQVCDAMERIADGLPDEVDRRLAAHVASCLHYDLPLHHRDEDEGLFPLLRARAEAADAIDTILDRLVAEHDLDTDFADEIAEPLDLLARGVKVANAEMVGYMLRGFFERYRRHVRWEDTLVMPLARLRLTSADLDQLARKMEQNRATTV
ncbi:MAG: hemerythrin domain-containing protein [Rhizobiales bacterium]|nr:hemerythrin domain-containing protein [Hyphomicrobiales bacterium]MBI3673472.1 hemerythrin domain-containing protein [Hyphomicrobiales bacterium]